MTRDSTEGAGQFDLLFVCTGNVCRSALAERLARRGLRLRLGAEAARFRVESAGTASMDGAPVHPFTAEALTWLGADSEGFASRQLTALDVDGADLILSAGREHRDLIIAMRPSASRRVYLLREFARLADSAVGSDARQCAADQARQLVAEVAQLRGRVPYVESAEDEIADPAATPEAFLSCARTIDALVSGTLDALCRGQAEAPGNGRYAR
jgi:protein-tyrosine phosphatase